MVDLGFITIIFTMVSLPSLHSSLQSSLLFSLCFSFLSFSLLFLSNIQSFLLFSSLFSSHFFYSLFFILAFLLLIIPKSFPFIHCFLCSSPLFFVSFLFSLSSSHAFHLNQLHNWWNFLYKFS